MIKTPLGTSDHNVVFLNPIYRVALKRGITEQRKVLLWTETSTMTLQGCFDCTDWDVFKDVCSDLDELTETVPAYMTFCEENVIPHKLCTMFPNNKPWIIKSVKSVL